MSSQCSDAVDSFIGTIPSSDALIENIKKLKGDDKGWSNSCYTIEFDKKPTTSFRPPYGHKYSFYLKDAVDVPEYVVPFEAFRGMAENYNLELVYEESFHDVFRSERMSARFGRLFDRMVGDDEHGRMAIQGDEWDTAGLYIAFAFEKRGGF